jgi:hypothetical protein
LDNKISILSLNNKNGNYTMLLKKILFISTIAFSTYAFEPIKCPVQKRLRPHDFEKTITIKKMRTSTEPLDESQDFQNQEQLMLLTQSYEKESTCINQWLGELEQSYEKESTWLKQWLGELERSFNEQVTTLKQSFEEQSTTIEQRILELEQSYEKESTWLKQWLGELERSYEKGSTWLKQWLGELERSFNEQVTTLTQSYEKESTTIEQQILELEQSYEKKSTRLKQCLGEAKGGSMEVQNWLSQLRDDQPTVTHRFPEFPKFLNFPIPIPPLGKENPVESKENMPLFNKFCEELAKNGKGELSRKLCHFARMAQLIKIITDKDGIIDRSIFEPLNPKEYEPQKYNLNIFKSKEYNLNILWETLKKKGLPLTYFEENQHPESSLQNDLKKISAILSPKGPFTSSNLKRLSKAFEKFEEILDNMSLSSGQPITLTDEEIDLPKSLEDWMEKNRPTPPPS